MHKAIVETINPQRPKEGRLLARVLAEDLRRVRGQEAWGPLDYLVTGTVRRDWSDPEFEGFPEF